MGNAGKGKVNSRFGWLHLVDLPLELVPGRRGRRGSTRHLCGVKNSATRAVKTAERIRD
jgi:hypothetical protein